MSKELNKQTDNSNELYKLLPTVFAELNLEKKHKLFAIWLSKKRIDGSKTLDIMFALDDIYQEIYNENRIKIGFSGAELLAYEKILTIVYGG
jgi:hypothetical protein